MTTAPGIKKLAQPPELVIFDVDGTLNGIELWWPDLIRQGLQEFAAARGITIAEPDDIAAMLVVGQPDVGVWQPFLPDGEKHRWPELRAAILPMEVDVLRSGTDYLYPGVREVLGNLRRSGVRLALASNCGQVYMNAISEGQRLGELTDWQFCLDSEGVATKADMVRNAIAVASRSLDLDRPARSVFVGDRETDLEAAREHGVPFVWRANPYCELGEFAEGCWNGEPEQLLRCLGFVS